MAQPIKVRKSAAARASASASSLNATGIDIDPVEQARKLQFMHRLGLVLLAIVFGLLNVLLLVAQPRAAIPAASKPPSTASAPGATNAPKRKPPSSHNSPPTESSPHKASPRPTS